MKHFTVILPVILALSACSVPNDSTPVPNTASSSSSEAQSSMSDSYIGLSEADAEAKANVEGVPFRVVMRDGESLPVTMDFRPGRINATVENGFVTEYEVEGSEEMSPPMTYDQNSWQTMVAASCMSFFDGCNNCNRSSEDGAVGCTKKFCQQYEEPKCLDGEQ